MSTLIKAVLLLVVSFVLLAGLAHAETRSFQHTIASMYPEQTRVVSVRVPPSYSTALHVRYPVLYLLDGEFNLDYSVAVADYLSANGLMPEVIIVGLHAGTSRKQDYLPNNEELNTAFSGDAGQFLTYIENELIALVESKYRSTDFRMLSGHSYGGVFVLHAMAKKPHLFQAYLTQSPFLDETIGPAVVERLQTALHNESQDNGDLEAFHYMTWGNEPNLDAQISDLRTWARADSPESIDWQFQQAVDQQHMTTRLLGQYHGLVSVFVDRWTLPQSELSQDGALAVTRHLQVLTDWLGESVRWSEALFQQAVQVSMSQQDLRSALSIAEQYIEQYSESPVAFLVSGSLHLAAGNTDQATEAVNFGIELYQTNPSAELAQAYTQLRAMKTQLGQSAE